MKIKLKLALTKSKYERARAAVLSQKLRQIIDQFRLLKDWNIEFDNNSMYKGQCTRNGETKRAVIYGWADNNIPDDYFFHELLHIMLADLVHTHATQHYKVARQREEEFVQDLCKFIKSR